SLLFWRLLRRLMPARWALVAWIPWMLFPYFLRIHLNGLSSSLWSLMLLGFMVRLLAVLACPKDFGAREGTLLGILAAGAFLSRLDSVLLIGGFLLMLVCRLWQYRDLMTREGIRLLAAILAPTAICAAAYSVTSQAMFGIWLPVSAVVKVSLT